MTLPFTFQYQTFNRADGGIVAKAAYRLGAQIEEESSGFKWDYTRKNGVAYMQCLIPTQDGFVQADPHKLWNAVDKHENRKNSRLAREFMFSLPADLPFEEKQRIAQNFATYLMRRYGVAVTFAIHEPPRRHDRRNKEGRSDKNWHVHMLITTRSYDGLGFGPKTRILDGNMAQAKKEILALRYEMAELQNQVLKENGFEERVDPRRLDQQEGHEGEIPHVHLGPAQAAMERRGIRTALGDVNRMIDKANALIKTAHTAEIVDLSREIEQTLEVEKNIVKSRVATPKIQKRFDLDNYDFKPTIKIENEELKNRTYKLLNMKDIIKNFIKQVTKISSKGFYYLSLNKYNSKYENDELFVDLRPKDISQEDVIDVIKSRNGYELNKEFVDNTFNQIQQGVRDAVFNKMKLEAEKKTDSRTGTTASSTHIPRSINLSFLIVSTRKSVDILL